MDPPFALPNMSTTRSDISRAPRFDFTGTLTGGTIKTCLSSNGNGDGDEAEPRSCRRCRNGPVRSEQTAPAPRETRRRLLFRRLIRAQGQAARAIAREGSLAFAVRKVKQALDRLTERARVSWQSRRKWKADGRPVFLFISHRCGGGTEQHLRHLITTLYDDGIRAVVVRPGRAGFLLWEERDALQSVVWCRESSIEQSSVTELIDRIGPVHAHVHHTMGIPMAVVDALIDCNIPYDWTIHDYYTICPRVNLVNEDHRYCGEPNEAGCNHCLSRNGDDQGRPFTTSIERWRQDNLERLTRCAEFWSRAPTFVIASNDIFRI